MKSEEIQKVAEIAITADGGCSVCAGNLLKRYATLFDATFRYDPYDDGEEVEIITPGMWAGSPMTGTVEIILKGSEK